MCGSLVLTSICIACKFGLWPRLESSEKGMVYRETLISPYLLI